MLTDVYIANALTPCDCGAITRAIEMRTTLGFAVSGFPVTVYDVNEVSIGVANDKSEYMAIWNARPANSARGTLSGHVGPFYFKFTINGGPIPTFVFGNPIVETGNNNNIVQEDNQDILQEDDQNIIIE